MYYLTPFQLGQGEKITNHFSKSLFSALKKNVLAYACSFTVYYVTERLLNLQV